MSRAGQRLISAAKELKAHAHDEHVWAVCDYLRMHDGLRCEKCPRVHIDKLHGEMHHMCFSIAEETIVTVDVTRPLADSSG